MLDLLIKNVLVLDGSGGLPFHAGVGVKAGKIAAVIRDGEPEAAHVIDGTGKALAPRIDRCARAFRS